MKVALLLFMFCVASEADDYNEAVSALEERLNTLEAQLKSNPGGDAASASRLSASETKIDKLQLLVEGLQTRLSESETLVEELQRHKAEMTAKFHASETQILKNSLSSRDNKIQLLEIKLSSGHQQHQLPQTKLTSDMEALKRESQETAAKLRASEKDLTDLRTKLSTTEYQVQVHHTRLSSSEDNVEALKKECREMASELTASQKQVELLQTRLSTIEDHLEVHHTKLNTTENLETEGEALRLQEDTAVLLVNLDCEGIYKRTTQSGVYTIYPTTAPVKVYCDMDTDGGKWTVIQRRLDGTVDFKRPWAQYKAGFGDASGEYWLGLENIHLLTKDKKCELRVDMEDFEGNTASASYSSFSVGSEADGYILQVAGFRNGGAGDSLTYHNGMKFSTFDKGDRSGCANSYSGAFWYNNCHNININGLYLRGKPNAGKGVTWFHWKGHHYSLKAVAMKIRRVP